MPKEIGTEPRLVQTTCHNRPRGISGASRKAEFIVAHPVRSHDTENINSQLNRQAFASIRRLRELRVPHLQHHQYLSLIRSRSSLFLRPPLTGIVAVFIPFPNPATIRPTIICGIPYAEACRTAPMARTTEPSMIIQRRPSRSPAKSVKPAPKKQPIS